MCLFALALLAASPAPRGRAQAVSYTVTDLGTLGGAQSKAFGIDNCGRVVGDSWPAGSTSNHPFFWNGQFKDIEPLGGTASALNGSGLVVGNNSTAAGDVHAFLWSSVTLVKTDIGTLPGGSFAAAFDINDAGQVVGQSETAPLVDRAFVWDSAAGIRAVPASGGLTPIAGYGINNAGRIVGVAATASGPLHAYASGGGGGGPLTDLGTFGGRDSFAFEINEAGQVAGYSDLPSNSASVPFHAFVWHDDNNDGLSEPGEMKDLGTLPGGSGSIAYDINATGQVVGYSEVTGGASHAFVYDTAMHDLNAMIDQSLGWTLQEARSINDRGQIVGFGLNPSGQTHAFLLTPVSGAGLPPSTVSSVSGGGVFNGTATLTATLTDCGSPLSNKAVSFTLNGAAACGVNGKPACPTTNPSGVATLTGVSLSGIDAGTYPNFVGASFAGDTNNAGSSSTGTLTVSKAPATITLSNLTQTYDGNPKGATATTNPPGLSGVSISYGQNGAPVASPTNAGSYDVVASLTNNNYQANNATGTLIIGKATSATAVSVSNATYDAQPHGATAAATGAGGLNQALTVTYSGRNVTAYGPSTVAPTNAGDYTASAAFSGDINHTGSSDSKDFTIAKAGQTITFGALSNKTFGNPDFSVSAAATSGLSVSFSATGNCTVSGNTVHITGAGSCAVTASQAGNSNFNAAPDVQQSFQIAKAATATALSSTANPSAFGQPVTFTALVASSAGVPTGTVQFKADGNNLGGAAGCVAGGGNNCTAQVSTSGLSAGSHTITADYSGDANFNASAGALSAAQVVGGLIEFSQATYTVAERGGSTLITVRRGGDTSGAVTVDYATDDGSIPSVAVPCKEPTGIALERCDYTRAAGTLNFAAGETDKSFVVLVNDDSYTEGTETLSLRLSNPAGGASLGAQASATLQITDDSPESTGNPVDDSQFFVRQHYHDFLNREPDQPGLEFWVGGIESCGADSQCREVKRINTSAAFFLSIEFQETGYLVERFYKAAYGDTTSPNVPVPVPVIRLNEFLADTQRIGRGVVVGQGNWQQQLEDNKNAFASEFVQRPRFLSAYPLTETPAQFVDALFANTGVSPSSAERQAAVGEFGPATNTSDQAARARALRRVAENAAFAQAEFNRAFVLMQYYGYLRRNPDDAPDGDFRGWKFWLDKLNQFNGNFVQAEMVKAFISSTEYRQRFGQP